MGLPDGPPLSDEQLRPLTAQVKASGEPVRVTAPFTGADLALVPQCTAADVAAAVARARAAQQSWAATPPAERAAWARRLAAAAGQRRDEVIDLVQWETGKARLDALVEAAQVVSVSRYYAAEVERTLRPQRRPGVVPGLTRTVERHVPKGVVTVITPWNYPVALAADNVIPALMAGNAVVHKPDTQTTLSTLWLRRLAVQAGLPSDLWLVVPGDPAEIGDALLDGVDHVAFTGSTAAGRRIAEAAGRRLIGASMELGGKNPMVVLPDADLAAAAAAVPRASFGNAGQLCMAMERVYVPADQADRFLDLVGASTRALRLGPALDFSTDVGSLTMASLHERVTDRVEQARAAGATVRVGGRSRPDLGPRFYEPTVLTDVPETARLHREEVFGPVVAVYPYDHVDEAVRLANDTEYGLTASVWGRDLVEAQRVAGRIRAGGVGVNDGYAAAYGSVAAPMGGMKASGVGRRHGREGLLRYTEAQTVATQRGPSLDSRLGLPRSVYGRVLGKALTSRR